VLNFCGLMEGYLEQTWDEEILCWNVPDKRGVILGKTKSHQNLLAVFFRPIGFNFEDRDENIREIMETSDKYKTRFAFKPCNLGEGEGGLEIFAYTSDTSKQLSRFQLITDWVDIGDEIGSIGWVPKELNSSIHNLIPTYPHFITHFASPYEGGSLYPSLYLCLMIWNLTEKDCWYTNTVYSPLIKDLLSKYDLTYKRTNLQKWVHVTTMKEAWNLIE